MVMTPGGRGFGMGVTWAVDMIQNNWVAEFVRIPEFGTLTSSATLIAMLARRRTSTARRASLFGHAPREVKATLPVAQEIRRRSERTRAMAFRSSRRLAVAAVAVIGTGCALLALFRPAPNGEVVVGLLLGTMFGQATLAAGWTCFGVTPWPWRVGAAVIWLSLLVLSLAAKIRWPSVPSEVVGAMALCLAGQWILVQAPLWVLAVAYRLKLRERGIAPAGSSPRQYGLKQLLIFTTVVAVLLGIGRVAVPALAARLNFSGVLPFFIFLAAAAILMTVPLLLAALLPKISSIATIGMLILIALVTMYEGTVLETVFQNGFPGPKFAHFAWINFFSSAWVVLGVMSVRMCGYELASIGERMPE
jgi:hypothetical protein